MESNSKEEITALILEAANRLIEVRLPIKSIVAFGAYPDDIGIGVDPILSITWELST